jgi:hypothetical protein
MNEYVKKSNEKTGLFFEEDDEDEDDCDPNYCGESSDSFNSDEWQSVRNSPRGDEVPGASPSKKQGLKRGNTSKGFFKKGNRGQLFDEDILRQGSHA